VTLREMQYWKHFANRDIFYPTDETHMVHAVFGFPL